MSRARDGRSSALAAVERPRYGATPRNEDSMHLRHLLAVVFLSLGFARGQTCFFSHASDPMASNANPGEAPLGVSTGGTTVSRLTQFVVQRYRFQNAPVSISGLAFSVTVNGAMRYSAIRVRMAHTTHDNLDVTFANNFATAPQVVLDSHDYVWPHRQGEWTEIGLQSPFVYTPAIGNLLIEVRVTGMVADHTTGNGVTHFRHSVNTQAAQMVVRDYLGNEPQNGSMNVRAPTVRLCSDLANLLWLGESCGRQPGSRPGLGFAGSSQLGATTSIVLSNAQPARFAVLAFGFTMGQPFPQSLTPIGMTGCWQYFNPTVVVGLTTDGLGVATHRLAIPNQPAIAGRILFSQYFVTDAAANAAGAVSTNLGRIQPGF